MKKIISFFTVIVIILGSLTACSVKIADGNKFGGNYYISSMVADMLEKNSYYDHTLSDEELAKAIVEEYKKKTGDKYAEFFTAEEFASASATNQGKTQGIGITVMQNTEHSCVEIVSVVKGSPADESGVEPGDLIVQVGAENETQKTSDIGYDAALEKLRGEEGTICKFGVVRNGDFENIIEFSVERKKYTSVSVMYEVSSQNSTVGIIKITNFDLTTPNQFKEAMTELTGKGCNSFIYDVRDNPGGDLASIRAILSYFLNKDDVIIIQESANGKTDTTYCSKITYDDKNGYNACNVSDSDIGMYRKYPIAVLTNGNTASAAELFTGTLKAYGLATVVGENTFGKGCVQTTYPLYYTDGTICGAIKMTTTFYSPFGMENYHGVGIAPTEGYGIELSEEAKAYNIYKLMYPENQHIDNQLSAAITAVTNK